jgi:hypothetical protein
MEQIAALLRTRGEEYSGGSTPRQLERAETWAPNKKILPAANSCRQDGFDQNQRHLRGSDF